ncbi:hypothetical protein AFLA_014093 [Aspergillus flavus NRRL3357]|nr:hypothetical protein AFLA_014093 [Aspergillus flavus NRRL3357]
MTKDNGELIVVSMLHPLRTALRWYNSYAIYSTQYDTLTEGIHLAKLEMVLVLGPLTGLQPNDKFLIAVNVLAESAGEAFPVGRA